ncbi:DNA-binding transcriptional LysR family regulator [Crossiella equi]|uniref:DNA-binding transcriptional LysR family regulator n=1 Tax=Crossiella equi TaxID=130796 RepID=A0ABS5A9G3_9PSEU|nr:LysR family transcriptional regulator [Crossiella equi]MBP2472375.1 DNA-binding transcriptional LysR family regulator [Crossiella equi]
MAQPNLHNVDLNLLVSLHAILSECSVTRAAARLSVSQSTMSTSLSRLRRMLNDPLLTKNGRDMVLTPLARSMMEPVAEILAQVEHLVATPSEFDPRTSKRNFSVVTDDYTLMLLIKPLLEEIDELAPEIRLTIIPVQPGHLDLLTSGRADLVIWPQWLAPPEAAAFPAAELLTDEFVAAVAGDNPDVGETITLDELVTVPYIQVFGGMSPPDALATARASGMRNVVATTETFTSAAHMLPGTRLCTVLQRRLFARIGSMLDLRAVELDLPDTLPILTQTMYWHPRRTDDLAHRWLRSTLLRLASELSSPRATAQTG